MSAPAHATLTTSQVEAVVHRGWRRRLVVLAVDHSSFALSIVLAGFILLILLGTQILAWQWLLLLAAAGFGWAAYHVHQERADRYAVAQMMDQRLALHDALSTAWFLRSQPVNRAPAAIHLLNSAETIAATADPSQAFPFKTRRAWAITAALFAAALILFSARYLVTRQLNLQHSFLPLAVTQVFENLSQLASSQKEKWDETGSKQGKTLPPGLNGNQADRRAPSPKSPDAKAAGQDQAKALGDANQKGEAAQNGDPQQASNAAGQQTHGPKGDGADQGKPNANAQASESPNNNDQPEAEQSGANGPQKSSSLMDRMRDALSSALAKMKPNSSSQQADNKSQPSGDGQKGDDQSGSKDQSGDGQKDSGKDQSAQEQSAGEQSQQGTAKSQTAQGKNSATPSDKKGSDAQSGVGHSDGDKQVNEAEQAKAMGKLAEIIGKRSASLTGDMQVVPSGKQQLKTGYTHAQGQHADLGGEINRDEIPVEDQEYVREYMEMVRRKPAKSN